MRQFINGTDAAYADLARRARRACVTFKNQELPPGTDPGHASIGFEIDHSDESARLFVDRGISYSGSCSDIREWLTAGEKRFATFAELQRWITGPLALCYSSSPTGRPSTGNTPGKQSRQTHLMEPSSPVGTGAILTNSALRASDLTDIEAIEEQLPDHDTPLYINEQALFGEMSTRVRGQDESLRTVAARISHHLARRAPRRPATLFAIGPTGVGKTRTAEAVSEALHTLDSTKSAYNYLRLDMSEYQERYRVSQLLGSPQGYVGYGEGAQLIDALRVNPRTVVLFDEIEKAHKDVLRALMNAMDAGRLSTATTSTQGREVDCRYAIFIFTSNLDSTGILAELERCDGFGNPAMVDEVCRNHLNAAGIAPELIGRIGCFLAYRPLSTSIQAEIIALAIAHTAQEYGLEVKHIEPPVILYILNKMGKQNFGARPYQYLVDSLLGAPFAETAAHSKTKIINVCGGPPFTCTLVADT